MTTEVLVVETSATGLIPGNQLNQRRPAIVGDRAPRFGLMLSSLLVIVALATGCASIPTAATKQASRAAHDCSQLSAEIAKTEQTKRAALEKQKGAWKTIVPLVVAARYASGKSAVAQADKQLDKLQTEFNAKGCDREPSRPT
jgi:hypothetical protein